MSKFGAENIIAAGAVWLLIMLPSAAFGGVWGSDARYCGAQAATGLVRAH
ncbi:hypothetical protein GGR25_004179 [Kaistia hirudinis]|uniref:Uncharacterized protein n=1 Tax=Kaistia hirudinis TaxID=1293440 RepID=A0A840AXD1_9HYPH|nr:hypothetical protein [Kaistia hirudinis]MBB3933115.1 hypothetical protein [Kaistia hirudinis]